MDEKVLKSVSDTYIPTCYWGETKFDRIFDEIIKEAGKCESRNRDAIIIWWYILNKIERAITRPSFEFIALLGFRKYGVDGEFEGCGTTLDPELKHYRRILEIEVSYNRTDNKLTMNLVEVTA